MNVLEMLLSFDGGQSRGVIRGSRGSATRARLSEVMLRIDFRGGRDTGDFVVHCHILNLAGSGMMSWR